MMGWVSSRQCHSGGTLPTHLTLQYLCLGPPERLGREVWYSGWTQLCADRVSVHVWRLHQESRKHKGLWDLGQQRLLYGESSGNSPQRG